MELTDEQRQRIEENRKKALRIRQEKAKAKEAVHPYSKYDNIILLYFTSKILYGINLYLTICTYYRPMVQPKSDKDNIVTVAGQSYVDTDAGFLLNEDDLLDKNKPVRWYILDVLYYI